MLAAACAGYHHFPVVRESGAASLTIVAESWIVSLRLVLARMAPVRSALLTSVRCKDALVRMTSFRDVWVNFVFFK